jgi:hypothetical protein
VRSLGFQVKAADLAGTLIESPWSKSAIDPLLKQMRLDVRLGEDRVACDRELPTSSANSR